MCIVCRNSGSKWHCVVCPYTLYDRFLSQHTICISVPAFRYIHIQVQLKKHNNWSYQCKACSHKHEIAGSRYLKQDIITQHFHLWCNKYRASLRHFLFISCVYFHMTRSSLVLIIQGQDGRI